MARLVQRARCTQRRVRCRCCCHFPNLHRAGTAAQSQVHRPPRVRCRRHKRQAAPKSTPRGGSRPPRSTRSSQPPGTEAHLASGRASGAAIVAMAQSRRRQGGERSAKCRPSRRRMSHKAAPSRTATALAAWQVVQVVARQVAARVGAKPARAAAKAEARCNRELPLARRRSVRCVRVVGW